MLEGSDDEGWWRRVVLKDGDWGKWWLREVVEWMCTCCCKTHCNGCMNVAWDLGWGGSRSTKPCIFPWKNFEEMRKVDQCSDEMKTVEKNLLRWHVRRDGKRWEELRWGEMRWEELTWFEMRWSVECEVQVWSMKCGLWRVQRDVWRKCSLGVALHRGRAQVMFLDSSSATGSHKARAHGPGWRTAHASSTDEKGLIVQP